MKQVNVWGGFLKPNSTDPILFDEVPHQVSWSSVYGTLVSTDLVGEISPQIALSWTSEDTFKKWKFKIKEDCYFENGEKVTPKSVIDSFKRTALIMKIRNSKSGIFEDLVQIENLKNLNTEIDGFSFDDEYIFLSFKVPKKDLLYSMAFGLYSIVHSSSYNSEGVWIDKNKIVSSGAYKVSNFEPSSVEMTLNELNLSCYNIAENNIKSIHISFGSENLNTEKQDIGFGTSRSLMYDESFEFLGPSDSSIAYMQIFKKFDSQEKFLTLRNLIHYELNLIQNKNFELVQSFLPLSLVHDKQPGFTLDAHVVNELKNVELRIPIYAESAKNKKINKKTTLEVYYEMFKNLKEKYGMNIIEVEDKEIPVNNKSEFSKYYDVDFLTTGLVIESPYNDIQFMFRSKEGIQLPDVDKTIEPLLDDVPKNIQLINRKIWEQARIVPIYHFSSGFWYKRNLFNLKRLNHTNLRTNFQFIHRQ